MARKKSWIGRFKAFFNFNTKGGRVRAGVVLFLIVFAYFFAVRPVFKVRAQAREVTASARALKDAFTKNDIELVNKELDNVQREYKELGNEAKPLYWAVFIPYVADLKNGIEAGDHMLLAADEAVTAITPYADLIGFTKGESSFVEKTAEDRLQTAVLTLDKVLVRLDVISEHIDQAEKRLEKINPNRYPEKIGKTVIKSRLVNIKEQFSGLASLFVDAKPLLRNIPNIMGKNEEKNYLILFQNDKERRATGGFLTSYTVFNFKEGKLTADRSEDIYELDNSISSHPAAPPEISTYHKNVYQFNIRDSNLSPDVVESVKLFNSLYEDSSEQIDYDGIFFIDSKVLVDMLTIYGDTEVAGVRFSAQNDDRCDCPQVLYTLFDIVDRPVNYIKEDRKGILGQLMFALLNKALGFSPSKYYGTLFQTMFKDMQEKHILLYFTDPELQEAAENINFAGRIREFDGDYLHINNVNFAGAKSNLFVTETVESKTDTKSREREVTITYRNPYEHSDCNLERGGLCLNAQLRNWIRIYVPKGSKLVNFTGSETEVQTYEDLGKTVYEGFLRVNPLGTAKVIVKYTLPESVSTNDYQLMVQRQPGADTTTLKVEVDGKKLLDVPFLTDKTVGTKE